MEAERSGGTGGTNANPGGSGAGRNPNGPKPVPGPGTAAAAAAAAAVTTTTAAAVAGAMAGTSQPRDPQEGLSLPGILHFIQFEWGRFQAEKYRWEAERDELRAQVAFLQGERKGQENMKQDLVRRIKMLEYALKQERAKHQKLKAGTEQSTGEKKVEAEAEQVPNGPGEPDAEPANQMSWKEGRQLLRKYLEDVGYSDTILDMRSKRVRSLLDRGSPEVNGPPPAEPPPEPQAHGAESRLVRQIEEQIKSERFLTPRSELINCVASHPAQPISITAHENRTIRFLDNKSGKVLHSMVAHLDAVTCLTTDPKGTYLISGSHDCSVRLWTLDNRTCVQEITAHRKKHDEAIHDVAFHPCQPFIASAGADALAKIFV
nr:striatin-4 [Paramormyrops kingsleyae]